MPLVTSSCAGDAKLKLTEADLIDDAAGEEVAGGGAPLAALAAASPASFSPGILLHVHYHVGSSWVIFSFVSFPLEMDSAALELIENGHH